jgi:hypothetical protein
VVTAVDGNWLGAEALSQFYLSATVMPIGPIELAAQHAAALKIYGRIRRGTDHCEVRHAFRG